MAKVPSKMVRYLPSKSWEDWKQSNASALEVINGRLSYIRYPDWHGSKIKGRNAYNFSHNVFNDLAIFGAFAEGLVVQDCTFKDVVFEEGDFSRANFQNCTFINTRFNKTIFTHANFNGASFINCNLNRVNLTDAQFCLKEITETVVYGIATWDLHTCEGMKQSKLVIEKTYQLYSDFEKEGKIPMMVDDIELAQFIYYLSDHKRLRNTINILNNKGVLLLGQFNDGGRERLYKVYDWLRQKEYMPMIFDFNRPEQMNYTETIVTMAGLSKFIIADLSGGSVPQELYAITTNYKKPIIAYSKGKAYSMFLDIKDKNPNVIDFEIEAEDEIITKIEGCLPEIEKMNKQIILMLAERYK